MLLHFIDRQKYDKLNIFISKYEHNSNMLPFKKYNVQILDPDGIDNIEFKDSEFYFFSLSICSNVTGRKIDIPNIPNRSNIFVNIDACAYVHTYRLDVSKYDSIIFSGHKFYGGIGTSGVMIIKKDRIRGIEPYNLGGGVIIKDSGQIDYDNMIVCGSSNTLSYIKLAKCIQWNMDNEKYI